MKFEDCSISALKPGFLLAHSLKTKNLNFKKGRSLSELDIQNLKKEEFEFLTVAILEQDDVHEDQAAAFLSDAINASHLDIAAPFTGRVNIVAKHSGIFTLSVDDVINFNMIDEGITIATLPNHSFVQSKQLVATIKIIPFAVSQTKLNEAINHLNKGQLQLNVFQQKNVTLIQTNLPSVKPSVLDKTTRTLQNRLDQLSAQMIDEERIPHQVDHVKQALENISDQTDLIILTGASAITDKRDIIPTAIISAGGSIQQYGMPVDPGNLLLLGSYKDKPVIAMPGCARSPKLNGFDWVLQRVCADIPINERDMASMSIGGLLKEIPSRPAPRHQNEQKYSSGKAAKFGIILLAAGQSRRMGKDNKLLTQYNNKALLDHALECIHETNIDDLIVVTGHAPEEISNILSKYKLSIIHNPDYETGIASSLKTGISNLPRDCDAVMICLSDMPLLKAHDLELIMASFSKEDNREICIPTFEGKRGNPVLIGNRFFPEIMELSGDIGAKPVISAYPDFVCEVPMPTDAILVDTDTPEALRDLHTR
ncbi:NTP transferase domain-containing protein [Curvivirga aplysinae]|uniref:NTP transferase domain-containing protein n=1 Tax=Curvivirga aplysinae TaxID=2529852 RepID=UPI0012BB5509|nr:molybdopterin-binding/glycosyltransferase family 2 protein [Curvivirga aplysinae]MTI09272.1 4-diphosphocytidyl-2C-methyl-D-erythritol kinase [Curvivirga aplysinae]